MATAPSKLIDISTRHQVHLERLKSGHVKEFDRFLQIMARDIQRKLSTATNLSDFRRARLEGLLAAINETLRDTWRDYAKVFRKQVTETAKYEAAFERHALEQVAVNRSFKLPSVTQLEAAVYTRPLGITGVDGGLLLEPFFERWTEKTLQRVEGAIRLGHAQGETLNQVMQRVRGTRANGFRDGVLRKTHDDVTMMVRTAMQHVSAQAREQTWRANSDIVKEVRWVSTLDNRTTQQCQGLDGREFPIDKGPRPPIHIGCRSAVVAVLDDRFSMLEQGATRAARDDEGNAIKVPAKQTYYDWLKGQPAAFQDSAIGSTRGKLLRDGGLSAERFAELSLGKNFEPMNLEQMRQLEPVAFERAGL